MIKLTLGMLVLVASCGKKTEGGAAATGSGSAPAAAPMDGCKAAIDHAMPLELAEMKKAAPNLSDVLAAKFMERSIAHCKEDHWSPGIVACMAAVKTADEIPKCGKLTLDQTTKLEDDMKAIMSAPAAAPASTAGLPSECADYAASMAKVQTGCEKLPTKAKAKLQEPYAKMAEIWKDYATQPPKVQAMIKQACSDAGKALLEVTRPGEHGC